jgi:hypothetical protein
MAKKKTKSIYEFYSQSKILELNKINIEITTENAFLKETMNTLLKNHAAEIATLTEQKKQLKTALDCFLLKKKYINNNHSKKDK